MTRKFLFCCVCVGVVCGWGFVGAGHGAVVRSKGGIDAALDRKVRSYVFSGTFEKCLADLGKVGKISIVGDWRTLAIVGLTRDKQVTLNIKGARVSQLLDVAMARATPRGMHLGWYVDAASGTVRVTTQRGALANRPKAGLVVRSRRTGPTGPTFKFDQAPLSAVVQNFRDLSGLNIHVNWRSLAAINVDRDTAVTMNVSNVSFGRALDLVTDEISGDLDKMQRVYWVIDGGIVRIATGTALDTKLKTRIVDLGELVMPPVDVKMPRRIGLRGTRDSNTNDSRYDQPRDRGRDGGRRIGRVNAGVGIGIIGGGQGDDPADKGEALKENLIEIIKDSIGQDMWSPTGKGTITIMRNRLVVSQTLLGYKLLDRSIGSRKR